MEPEELTALARRIEAAFPPQIDTPSVSLRGGNALDDYETPPPYAPEVDRPDAAYIEAFHYGIHFLDPESWLYYLPILLTYSLGEMEAGTSNAVDTFLFSLRPPDRDPPRFGLLSRPQKKLVVEVLEKLGFSETSKFQDDALAALQEYWHDA